MTPKDFFAFAEKNDAQMVDLKFTDMLGTWQHCSFPIDTWDEATFEDGVGFDGSSIRGWQEINVSDMLAVPDAATTCMDPFFDRPTVSVIANIVDPESHDDYTRDPRHVARKAESYMQSTGLADMCWIGPEPEFFIFDEIRYSQTQSRGFYQIDSVEGAWNTDRIEEPNLGYKPSFKGGYFPVSPTDTYHDLRGEMVYAMRDLGIVVEAHHHEVGTAGQSEIDMKAQPMLEMADQFMWFKYIIKNIARRHGKTVTFMPKPIFEDNGSGMHTHLSLWKDGEPLFAGDKYAGLSQMALHGIGGLLHHASAVLAFAAPTTNPYRRLVPGYEAPINLVMSARNRSAAVRIPMYSGSPKAKRLEFRCPDPSCNGYLLFSAMLMAVLDGIENEIDPGDPMDRDIYLMTRDELAGTEKTPGSLDEALAALEEDHEFLTRGDVFTNDLIETWIEYKRENELKPMSLRPHPYEFELYYDN
ncbi:MAG: type I glutamate--ammonia ligase [Thermoanaerobaculia bacterium]|nr:type I glutamate--ammonia ligase [Thermoanaerobaculia bacterium]